MGADSGADFEWPIRSRSEQENVGAAPLQLKLPGEETMSQTDKHTPGPRTVHVNPMDDDFSWLRHSTIMDDHGRVRPCCVVALDVPGPSPSIADVDARKGHSPDHYGSAAPYS